MDWNLVLSVLSLVISSLLTVGIFYVGSKASKIDKLQEQLEERAGEIIEVRMQALESRLQISVKSLEHIVATMQQRLESGDQHFKNVDAKNHALELKVITQVQEMYRGLATREDVKELGSQVASMKTTIAELQARLVRRPEPSVN